MSASISRPLQQLQRFGRLWWLPTGGQGNGLDDDAWAPILEVGAGLVERVLRPGAGMPGISPGDVRRCGRRAWRQRR